MIRIDDVIEAVERYRPRANEDLLRKAYVFSAKEHKGQVRVSGEPYLVHPLAVAMILAQMKMDEVSIAVGLLHDVLEDTLTTREHLQEIFGDEIVHLVDGLTKISRFHFESKEQQQAESFRKMLLASIDDIRVIVVKLADRYHNMLTLGPLDEQRRRRIARETLDIYAPIANRLGMGHLKGELEDLSFRHLQPAQWSELSAAVESQHDQATALIRRVESALVKALEAAGLAVEVRGRIKRLSSIWKKLQAGRVEIDRVYDLLAFRIIAPDVKACYAALGVVHGLWRPVPERIKDYIGNPKPNRYQSLHTTVFGDGGTPFEVQIRTAEMNDVAERGVAAHWKYKEGKLTPGKDDELYLWLRQVVEWSSETSDPQLFLDTLKIDLYPEEVYALTPKGKVLALPRGATPIDFAYRIHTDVGHHCVGARVNGKQVPLKTEIANGDVVEILTAASGQASRDWLTFAKTARARSKIRHAVEAQQRLRTIELGRRLLERELHRAKLGIKSVLRSERLAERLAEAGLAGFDELCHELGSGRISARGFVAKLNPSSTNESPSSRPRESSAEEPHTGNAVIVEGGEGILTFLAQCCRPVFGEPIVGYVTRGRGVAVHSEECRNVDRLIGDKARQLGVGWGRRTEEAYPVTLILRTEERPGMLAAITEAVAAGRANILRIDARVTAPAEGRIELRIEVPGLIELDRLQHDLRLLPGVFSVERKRGARASGQERPRQRQRTAF